MPFDPIDPNVISRIATLARIGLSGEEKQALGKEIEGILSWISHLDELDVKNVEPLSGVSLAGQVQRPDAVTDGNCREAVLSNAADLEGPYFVVPKVVE